MKNNFNFSLEPGKKLKIKNYLNKKPEISIIVPFYNDEKYIEQSINCILNQTYPYFELLIIDDGSKDQKSLNKLKEIEKLDKRIKVFHKENEGLSATRDYGASVSSKETKYFLFIDSDDLIEPTYLECAYWTLETNKEASWAYSDTIGFDSYTYTWNKIFDSERMKKINDLIEVAFIRKEAYYEVNGYELREKAVNEDWNFWLKLISKGKYPVHMNFYGQWYRRKEFGELAKATANRKRSLEIINKTASTIKNKVNAIEYPKKDYLYNQLLDIEKTIRIPEKNKYKQNNILILLSNFEFKNINLKFIKELKEKDYNLIIISTETSVNYNRQEFEKYGIIYDLTTFLDRNNWISFINYIITKENINLICINNNLFSYSIIPYIKATYSNIPIIDFIDKINYKSEIYIRNSINLKSLIDKTLVSNKQDEQIIKDHYNKEELEIVNNNLSNIFKHCISYPNREKIDNGENLYKIVNITKEFILINYIKDKENIIEKVDNYYKITYKDKIKKSFSEKIKGKLWEIPLWRKLIRIKKKYLKK